MLLFDSWCVRVLNGGVCSGMSEGDSCRDCRTVEKMNVHKCAVLMGVRVFRSGECTEV